MSQFRVILVEDDAALRASLTDWLSKEYLVTQFESAEDLLGALPWLCSGARACGPSPAHVHGAPPTYVPHTHRALTAAAAGSAP